MIFLFPFGGIWIRSLEGILVFFRLFVVAMIRMKEMSSWTTSCTVGCSRTCFPQKIGKRNILGWCVRKKLVGVEESKKQKTTKKHISHKNQGKRKQSSRILVVVFWRVLGCYFLPPNMAAPFFARRPSSSRIWVWRWNWGSVVMLRVTASAWNAMHPKTPVICMHWIVVEPRNAYCTNVRRFGHSTIHVSRDAGKKLWREIWYQLWSALVGGWLGFLRRIYIFCLYFVFTYLAQIRSGLTIIFQLGGFKHQLVMMLVPAKKASDSTTMPWRWSKFRPNFFWYKKMRWRTQGQTNIHFMTDSGLMWPPQVPFKLVR